ncbi:MAG: hypothetical protein ACR2QM_02990, partial [Longimicrobiales bacterium]
SSSLRMGLTWSLRLLALCAVTGAFAPALHAQASCEDVSGVWAVQLNLPGSGQSEVTLTLDQVECQVTGLIEGHNKTPIQDGTVEGSTATFTAAARNQANGQDMAIVWTVTVDDDAVNGTLESPMMGTFEFTGARVEG